MASTVKLPVWGTVVHTYKFFWHEKQQFWQLALPAIIIVSLMAALADWAAIGATGMTVEKAARARRLAELPAWGFIMLALSFGAGIWAYVCYSVAWHRSFLVPGEGITIGSCYTWRGRHGRFLWMTVKIGLMAMISIAAVAAIGGGIAGAVSATGGAVFSGVVAAMIVAIFYYAMRLSVWLPAAAVDHRMSLGDVLALTRGNGWRLFGIIIYAGIPIGLCTAVLAVILGAAILALPNYGPLTAALLQNLVAQFIGYIGIAIGISALSVCYSRLRKADGERIEP
ncbi:MAG: hypothetical protein HQ503_06620 [Rhodospirillales bacterium]|nr:hypothetical protein [Rhodospirillales bacterium]